MTQGHEGLISLLATCAPLLSELPDCENCERPAGQYGDCQFCVVCRRLESAREELYCAYAALSRVSK